MKRGQAALEFLMTYGWAILVVIIVVGALAAFGVFDVSRLIPDKCVLPTQLSCQDFGYANGAIQLQVLNGLGRDVIITNVTLKDRDSTMDYYNDSSFSITNQYPETIAVTAPLVSKSGKYRFDIQVDYKFAGSEIEKTVYGDMALTVR